MLLVQLIFPRNPISQFENKQMENLIMKTFESTNSYRFNWLENIVFFLRNICNVCDDIGDRAVFLSKLHTHGFDFIENSWEHVWPNGQEEQQQRQNKIQCTSYNDIPMNPSINDTLFVYHTI